MRLCERKRNRSKSRKNKEWRRRRAKKAILKRNRDDKGILDIRNKNLKPLTRQERQVMYKWEKRRRIGLFGSDISPKARRAALEQLNRELGSKA